MSTQPFGTALELDEALLELDPDRRAAFVLTQVNGLRYEEAAELLDVPVGTIRSRVARAREQLTTALATTHSAPVAGSVSPIHRELPRVARRPFG